MVNLMILYTHKEDKTMNKKKSKRNRDNEKTIAIILIVTAVLNFLEALVDLIKALR